MRENRTSGSEGGGAELNRLSLPLSGYAQAEFAADLWQVYQGEGADEYRDPTEFFRRTYPNGFLQMPGSRPLAAPVDGPVGWYFANTRSEAVPTGMNQEQTIKAIWSADH